MKDETDFVAIQEFVGLNPKMYSFLVDDIVSIKNAKVVNKNVIARITNSENKDVLVNNNCLRHSMNRIQSKIIK